MSQTRGRRFYFPSALSFSAPFSTGFRIFTILIEKTKFRVKSWLGFSIDEVAQLVKSTQLMEPLLRPDRAYAFQQAIPAVRQISRQKMKLLMNNIIPTD